MIELDLDLPRAGPVSRYIRRIDTHVGVVGMTADFYEKTDQARFAMINSLYQAECSSSIVSEIQTGFSVRNMVEKLMAELQMDVTMHLLMLDSTKGLISQTSRLTLFSGYIPSSLRGED